jgi:SAM-dependent methyltransferase
MAEFNFIQKLHAGTRRDYVQRVVEHDKAACAETAQRWGAEYWDGERRFGYGGYRYDGRWRPVAEELARHLGLEPGMRLLDVGCGKGFLLYEFTQAVPGLTVAGLDISDYALAHAKDEVKDRLSVGHASALPYADASFDAVVSLGCLHNLDLPELWTAIGEMQRVCPSARKYMMVESFRTEREKANLLYWQLTCRSFHDPRSWAWLLERAGYRGDWGFIFFE